MTTMGIQYMNALENARANRAQEVENHRANVERERETNRSNLAREYETNRSNLVNELIGKQNAVSQRNSSLANLRNAAVNKWKAESDRDLSLISMLEDPAKNMLSLQEYYPNKSALEASVGGLANYFLDAIVGGRSSNGINSLIAKAFEGAGDIPGMEILSGHVVNGKIQ